MVIEAQYGDEEDKLRSLYLLVPPRTRHLESARWPTLVFQQTFAHVETMETKGKYKELNFLEVDCWVRIHDLPLEHYRESIEKKFAQKIGEFKGYDKREEFVGKHMRLKVGLKVSEPL